MRKTCLHKNCRNVAFSRGLCQTCYAIARHLIRSGLRSEGDFIRTGQIKPQKKRGRKAKGHRK